MMTLYFRNPIRRLPWVLAASVATCTLELGLSANAQRKTTFVTFDAPGTGAGSFQGTARYGLNPEGAIAGATLVMVVEPLWL